MQLPWYHPEIDLPGLTRSLSLSPLPARTLAQAADRITDPGLSALVTLVLLSSDPHRIARMPGPPCSGYRGAGGRALRAAVLTHAVHLLSRGLVDTDEGACLVAALLTTAVPVQVQEVASAQPCAVSRWLAELIRPALTHLTRWGCDPGRLRRVRRLVGLASGPAHLAYTRSRGTPTETTIVLACRAAEIASPCTTGPVGDRPLLPAWMDSDVPPLMAERLLWDDLTERHHVPDAVGGASAGPGFWAR